MARDRYSKHDKKETLLHKLITTVVSAAVMAVVAGVVGYKLNSNLPELYFNIAEANKIGNLYFVDVEVSNMGRGPATEIISRYSFNHEIVSCDYNYAEALNGKLPTGNTAGGSGTDEFLLSVPRMLAGEKLKASFIFADSDVKPEIKVFSKEVMGRPYIEWEEKVSKGEKIFNSISVWVNSVIYRIQKPVLNIPKIKIQEMFTVPIKKIEDNAAKPGSAQ